MIFIEFASSFIENLKFLVASCNLVKGSRNNLMSYREYRIRKGRLIKI